MDEWLLPRMLLSPSVSDLNNFIKFIFSLFVSSNRGLVLVLSLYKKIMIAYLYLTGIARLNGSAGREFSK